MTWRRGMPDVECVVGVGAEERETFALAATLQRRGDFARAAMFEPSRPSSPRGARIAFSRLRRRFFGVCARRAPENDRAGPGAGGGSPFRSPASPQPAATRSFTEPLLQ